MDLESRQRKSSFKNVSENSIKAKVEYAIKHLQEAPKEKHREVFDNVIQFAEIHSTKIKLGVYSSGSADFEHDKASGRKGAAAEKNIFKISGDSITESSCTFKVGGEGGI